MSTHTVNRLTLNLQTDSTEQAFHLRQTVLHTWQPLLTQVLNEVCSQYSDDATTLRIERLELDLGQLTTYELEERWLERFRNALTQALQNQLYATTKDVRQTPRSLTQLELLAFFLQTGHFPWWASAQEETITQLLEQLIQTQPEALKILLQHLLTQPVTAQRFGYQCAPSVQAHLVESWDKDYEQANWFEAVGKQVFDEKWTAMASAPPYQAFKTHVLLCRILQTLIPLTPRQEAELAPLLYPWNQAVILSFVNKKAALPEAGITTIPLSVQPSDTSTHTSKTVSAMHVLPAEAFAGQPSESQKIHIRQAGIVLVAPFLPAFLQTLQLIENKAFRSEEAVFQAIHLLHYLATGSTHAPEYTLPLYKILCGIDLHTPVPLDIDLNEPMRTEANELLQAVIDHWKALKNTSIEGFRQAFINREGILTRRDDGWLLQIEHFTYDLLLEQLPWGIGLIRLPWMPEPIHTEW